MKQNLEKGHRQPLRLSVSYGLIWFCVILIVHSELKIFPKASSHFNLLPVFFSPEEKTLII
jgi:hypothetical protein